MTTDTEVKDAVERFNDAVNSHNVDAVVAAMTEDCFFESTMPPDGDSYQGSAAIAAFFGRLFDAATERSFETEETITPGDRVIVRWRHHWTDAAGVSGHVRGVDLFRVRDGKIAEKLSYVKG